MKWCRGNTVAIVLSVLVIAFVLMPRADGVGQWREDLVPTADALVADISTSTHVTLTNVRDYTYAPSTTTTRDWKSTTIDPTNIERVWFYLEPFPYWQEVGHTFLSFEMKDGSTIAFSIEARVEAHDKYSALRGMFGAYELALQWGEERDFVARRILKLGANLYRYPLDLSAADSQRLFVALANETHKVATKPRLYNTLTENCTNIFAQVINEYAPGALSPDMSWYLTGNADKYLMKKGYIKTNGRTVDEMRTTHNLKSHYDTISSLATSTPLDFATTLRTLTPTD